jgi:hypothetical protein
MRLVGHLPESVAMPLAVYVSPNELPLEMPAVGRENRLDVLFDDGRAYPEQTCAQPASSCENCSGNEYLRMIGYIHGRIPGQNDNGVSQP